MIARLLTQEGVTVATDWHIERLVPYLDMPVPSRRKDWLHPPDDTVPSITVNRYNLAYVIPEDDGGPIAIYRQTTIWR